MPRVATLVLGLVLAFAAPCAAQDALSLIRQAQEAAWADRNGEAATLYEQAFAADPALRATYLREYADQLTYSGRAQEAVGLYRQVLRGRLPRAERQTAQRGLALALSWSKRAAEAAEAWDVVIAANPGDTDARENLARQLQAAARDAAGADRNAEAAEHFGRLVRATPAPPVSLVQAYADQLTYAGRHDRALALYGQILETPGLDGPGRAQAERGRALALLWSERYAPASAAWQGVVRRDSGDADARRNLSLALAGQAREAGDDRRHGEAVTLYEGAIVAAPAARHDLLLDYAYQMAYADRAGDAVPLFEEVVRRNELNISDRLGHRGLGLALSWAGRHEEALAAYDRGLAKYPDDVDMLNGKGQVLIWLNRPDVAAGIFRRALVVDPDNETALRGVAQAESYMGRQRRATAWVDEVISQGDASAETLLVAARAEYWKGRPDKAFALADRVLADSPDHSGARSLIGEIDDSLRPWSELHASHSTQNDGLEITSRSARQGVRINDGLTDLGLQYRRINLNPDATGDVDLEAPGLFFRHRFDDDVEANGSVHFNTLTAPTGTFKVMTFDTWVTYWPNDLGRFDLSWSRNYFDDERSLARNILMGTLGLSADYFPTHGTQISGRLSLSSLSDGNSRFFAQVEAQRDVATVEGLHLGGRITYFGFSRPELNNGYFNPSWLYSIEGTGRYGLDVTDRWRVEAGGTLGFERRADLDKLLWNLAAKATYRLTDRAAIDFEVEHNDHRRVDAVDGFSRTTFGTRLVYRW